MPKKDVKFLVTYDSGHEEWFWIDERQIWGGDHMVAALVRQGQQRELLPAGNIQSVKRAPLSEALGSL